MNEILMDFGDRSSAGPLRSRPPSCLEHAVTTTCGGTVLQTGSQRSGAAEGLGGPAPLSWQ